MKKRIRLFTASLIAVLLSFSAYSQIHFQGSDSILVDDYIAQIESVSNFRIYVNPDWPIPRKISVPKSELSYKDAIRYLSRGIGYKIIQFDRYNYLVINETESGEVVVDQIATESAGRQIIGNPGINTEKEATTISGIILDANTGEAIIGATLQVQDEQGGTSSNTFGKFNLRVPYGNQTILIQSIGYKAEAIPITALSDGKLDVELFVESQELEEITIQAEALDANVTGSQMGLTKLDMKGLKNMPSFMGEADIIKSIIMLPGVSTVGEGSSGFNVRGGETSQNLILLDDIIIFNPSHLFGFFTSFQGDLINTIEFFKGGMPANYGGRLASVLQVNTREGSMTDFKGKVSLGAISSSASLEGPLVKNKGSFIVGGRGSYINWLLQKTKNIDLIRSEAGFGDYTGKVNLFVGDNNKLTVSGYLSWDNFSFASDTTYQIQNQGVSIKWDHIFNEKLFGSVSLVAGKNSTKLVDDIGYNAFTMNNEIKYQKLKLNINSIRYDKHKLDFGTENIIYRLEPGTFIPADNNKIASKKVIPKSLAIESAWYINDQIDISEKLSATVGLRFVAYSKLGPSKVYLYEDMQDRQVSEITDSLEIGKNKGEKLYGSIEPRLSFRYSITPSASLKVGYNRVNQYLHLITNSTTVVPTDFWMNSNYHIPPSVANQVSVGLFKNISDNKFETSFEVFYKTIENAVDYREGGNIYLNKYIESDLLLGVGKAYGYEVFVKKTKGLLTGWFSYTFSRSLRKVQSDNPDSQINLGLYYPSNFDKPHDLSFVGQYAISKRVKFNWNFVYGSGRPITAPDSRYRQLDVLSIYNYSERNQYNIPVYHRLDLGFTVEENLRNDRNIKTSWTLSVYNAYGRKNAYSIFFNNSAYAYKLSVLGTIFPSLTYKVNFL